MSGGSNNLFVSANLERVRYPRHPNYYYINRHPKIRSTMNIDEENYLHPKNGIPSNTFTTYPPKEIASREQTEGRFQRFDSGVSDLENGSSGEFPMQIPRSCSPRPFQYDYADFPSHQYEEVPIKSVTYVRDESQSHPVLNSTSDIPAEEENQSQSQSETSRKRVNPLYEAVSKAIPSPHERGQKLAQDEAVYKQFRCLRISFILVVVVMVLSLISIFCVVMLNQPKEEKGPTDDYQELKRKYILLEKKLEAMNQNHNMSDSRYKSLEDMINNRTDDIIFNAQLIHNLTLQLDDTVQHYEAQLKNISKMPGPRGRPGAGNFSKCEYRSFQGSSSHETTSTMWMPQESKLRTHTVISASCSTENGVATYLSNKNKQYKCSCVGKYRKNVRTEKCILHIWLCPTVS